MPAGRRGPRSLALEEPPRGWLWAEVVPGPAVVGPTNLRMAVDGPRSGMYGPCGCRALDADGFVGDHPSLPHRGQPGRGRKAATIGAMSFRKAFLLLVCLKLYAFALLYLQFRRTDMTDNYTAFVFVPDGSTRAERLSEARRSFSSRLAPYDGQLYLDIAAKGYRVHGGPPSSDSDAKQGNYAFFPLFPAILRALGRTFGDPVPAALVMDLLLSSLALAFVWKLAGEMGVSSSVTCGLMLAFPAAIFQYVLYTESLFLFLSVSFWIFLRRRRWFSAALVGFLGGLCRPQGVLLIFLAAESFLPGRQAAQGERPPRLRPTTWCVAIAPALGLATVMLINLQATGSVWSFLEVQGNWGRHIDVDSVLGSARELLRRDGALADLGGTVFGLVVLPLVWKRLPAPLALYATASVLMPLATGRVLSMGRFMSVSFPHFLALARLLESHRKVAWGIVGFFALFQLLLSKPLVAWHFVG
jgi:hypothetical protein